MALTIGSLTRLNEYITGVMERADHHGLNVNEIDCRSNYLESNRGRYSGANL